MGTVSEVTREEEVGFSKTKNEVKLEAVNRSPGNIL